MSPARREAALGQPGAQPRRRPPSLLRAVAQHHLLGRILRPQGPRLEQRGRLQVQGHLPEFGPLTHRPGVTVGGPASWPGYAARALLPQDHVQIMVHRPVVRDSAALRTGWSGFEPGPLSIPAGHGAIRATPAVPCPGEISAPPAFSSARNDPTTSR